MRPKPLVLVILDGVALNPKEEGNAMKLAKMPNFNSLWNAFPHSKLKAHGEAVGLEEGYIGGSEVGHLHMAAGRIVPQELKIINQSVRNKSFYKNFAFINAMKVVKKNNSRLHLIGLLSDGGVHSDYSHMKALLKLAKDNGIHRVFIHVFADGRDVNPRSVEKYLSQLEAWTDEIGVGKVATLIGRVYPMDRANRWERTQKAYELLFNGKGKYISVDPIYLVNKLYAKKERDEYFDAYLFDKNGTIKEGDVVINYNYRADRAKQLMHAISDEKFTYFRRKNHPKVYAVGMAPYSEHIDIPSAFAHPHVEHSLGEVISKAGLKQLRIAEKEKFNHVTFFFNGDSDKQFEGEDRICVKSPHVRSYDLSPAMSSRKVTRMILRRIKKYDFILVNFANGDMLGHTGNIKAAARGLEVLDGLVGKIVSKVRNVGGEVVITADHGNCDEMIKGGQISTNHSKNPVPFIIMSDRKVKLKPTGELSNVAPTILQLLRLKKPKEMTKSSLIV